MWVLKKAVIEYARRNIDRDNSAACRRILRYLRRSSFLDVSLSMLQIEKILGIYSVSKEH